MRIMRKNIAILTFALIAVACMFAGMAYAGDQDPQEGHYHYFKNGNSPVKCEPWTDILAEQQNGQGKTAANSLPSRAGNYYLTKDVNLHGAWAVPDGTTYFCLNGKRIIQNDNQEATIDINSSDASAALHLFDEEGNAGKITHADGILGSGVNVGGRGEFTMYGGTITGNTAQPYGGGVMNQGFFEMTGGRITGNAAGQYGGGVMNGNPDGPPAQLLLSGPVDISGNTKSGTEQYPSNVCLPYKTNNKHCITIADKLTNTSPIGIQVIDGNGNLVNSVFTTHWSEKMGSADPADFFESDEKNHCVTLTDDRTEARLDTHNWHYSAVGDTITATCSFGKCPLGKQTAKLSLPKKTYDPRNIITPKVTVSEGWTKGNGLLDPPTASDVRYVSQSRANYYNSLAQPSKPGFYYAEMTVGGATAKVSFAVNRVEQPMPDSKPIPSKVKGTLAAKMKAKKTSLTICWIRISGADGYDAFFAQCKHSSKKTVLRKVKSIKGNNIFKWTKSGLKKGTAYKAYLKAYIIKDGKKKYVKTSPIMHAYTGNGNAKYTNAKSVKVKKSKVTLKTGKTFKIKAKVRKVKKNKKLMPKGHAPKLRYMTSNSKVASVSSSGRITANGKGSCIVYVVAHNGVYSKIKVTVK